MILLVMLVGMVTESFVIVVKIPESKCPRVRGRDKLITDGMASVYLSINSTAEIALQGISGFGVSGGKNALVVTEKSFAMQKEKIENYLNNRFGSEWTLDLVSVKPN
ncbi:hypothetical protein GCM10027155_07250 [Acinetobacter apis]|uniref:Uncharacterized protein n=1 Tax=Acinetobacter apis TaxID=1229165 RepID=A0A217EEQ0_9GAMM|nr:hypothetical protein [Acinetobacter apis]SNQ28807.1 hypothetical protein SAMN05444584_0734 [Acinetobacter apis]